MSTSDPRSSTADGGPASPSAERRSTRGRILDVALDLFVEQGYDKTSLRDIAERMGFTKAALYYHFERKEDLFLELHLQLHELVRDVVADLASLPDDRARVAAWPAALDRFVGRAIEHPQLVLLHLRNASALAAIVDDERNRSENAAFERLAMQLLRNPDVALEQRVRMACSLGAVLGGLAVLDPAASEVSADELTAQVRDVVARLVAPR